MPSDCSTSNGSSVNAEPEILFAEPFSSDAPSASTQRNSRAENDYPCYNTAAILCQHEPSDKLDTRVVIVEGRLVNCERR